MSLSIYSIAILWRLSCGIVDYRYVWISFGFEKLLSREREAQFEQTGLIAFKRALVIKKVFGTNSRKSINFILGDIHRKINKYFALRTNCPKFSI